MSGTQEFDMNRTIDEEEATLVEGAMMFIESMANRSGLDPAIFAMACLNLTAKFYVQSPMTDEIIKGELQKCLDEYRSVIAKMKKATN